MGPPPNGLRRLTWRPSALPFMAGNGGLVTPPGTLVSGKDQVDGTLSVELDGRTTIPPGVR